MTTPNYPVPSQPSYQPGPPPPGYVAAQPLPPSTPKKRRWLVPSLIGGGIALALCCGGAIVALASGEPEQASNTASDSTAVPTGASPGDTESAETDSGGVKTYKVGQAVRGGDFEFVVRGHKCGIAQVGSSYMNRKAQGAFCRVDISVKNVTKTAHLFHADGTVTAQDATGREYQADGEANIYGNKDGAGFLDEINPGNAIRAYVYFDVPKGTKLNTITFDAGLFTLAEDAVVSL